MITNYFHCNIKAKKVMERECIECKICFRDEMGQANSGTLLTTYDSEVLDS